MIPRHLIIGVGAMLLAAAIMGFYVGRLRGRAGRIGPTASDARPIAPPPEGPTERVTLYVASDERGMLAARAARIPLPAGRQQRAQELLRALLGIYLDKSSPHPLAAGSEIRDVYLVDPGLAVIDVNEVFSQGHRSGILVEELTVTSLVQTLAANIPGITQVKILVEGKSRDTLAGHADLSGTFDVSAVAKMSGVKEE